MPGLLNFLGWFFEMEEALTAAGLGMPYQRMIFGAALAAGVTMYIQPEFVYRDDGTRRPWKVLQPNEKDATHLPFFLIPLVGSTFGVFV